MGRPGVVVVAMLLVLAVTPEAKPFWESLKDAVKETVSGNFPGVEIGLSEFGHPCLKKILNFEFEDPDFCISQNDPRAPDYRRIEPIEVRHKQLLKKRPDLFARTYPNYYRMVLRRQQRRLKKKRSSRHR
ncbi:PREDICTED: uncharacterized protein LOC104817052 [Tarenaya hassleriana]|uniref:uncharacterized protein LOC104817052 n=1 Tax=Tarenaya hassleriana TaxID=28532 RepID=UPI00053CA3CB|nr:PREDICTED: uncharacterized protein LOC104817052 [Tarenaya hassleriana]